MGDNYPLVSIALCTYNGSNFLREQIESLLNQTYKAIEIIIVDDCSTDKTVEIIKEYASNTSVIEWSVNKSNLGFNKNFELAISKCRGEYIAISDQDDIWKADKIKTLVDNIKNNWLIFSNSMFINSNGEQIDQTLLIEGFALNNRDFKSLLLYNYVTGHTCLFHKSFIKHIFPLPKKDFYDWWMGFIALYHNKLIYRDEALTYYRIHSDSYIQQKNAVKESKETHSRETLLHLHQVLKYGNFNEEDSDFISHILNAFKAKYSIILFYYIIRYYNKLFPDLKPREGFGLITFAFKYSINKSL